MMILSPQGPMRHENQITQVSLAALDDDSPEQLMQFKLSTLQTEHNFVMDQQQLQALFGRWQLLNQELIENDAEADELRAHALELLEQTDLSMRHLSARYMSSHKFIIALWFIADASQTERVLQALPAKSQRYFEEQLKHWQTCSPQKTSRLLNEQGKNAVKDLILAIEHFGKYCTTEIAAKWLPDTGQIARQWCEVIPQLWTRVRREGLLSVEFAFERPREPEGEFCNYPLTWKQPYFSLAKSMYDAILALGADREECRPIFLHQLRQAELVSEADPRLCNLVGMGMQLLLMSGREQDIAAMMLGMLWD